MDEQYEDQWPTLPDSVDTGERLLAWIHSGALEHWDRLWLGDLSFDKDIIQRLAASPALLHLKALNLRGFEHDLDEAMVCTLVCSPYVTGLTELSLDGTLITATGVQTIARAPALANVRILYLGNNDLGDAGVTALAASPVLRHVTFLGLHNSGVGDAGAQTLAASPLLQTLTGLDLAHNAIGDVGVQALAVSPLLAHLTFLDIHYNQFTDAGVQALAASAHLATLEDLDICDQSGQMSDAAMWNVVTSPHLTRLTRLCLSGIDLDQADIEELRQRFLAKGLH